MDVQRIHPDFRKAARRVPTPPYHKRWMLKLMRLAFRLGVRNSPIAEGVSKRDVHLSNRSIRIYTPDENTSGAGVLWIHGGGLILGTYSMSNEICSRYAKEFRAVVVSVGYRLAPEHQYPAASDDCFEAWQWFLEHAGDLGVDPERIAIGGQSAGGGLTAHLCQRILDHGGVQPVAQLLWYPMLDDRTAANTSLDDLNHLMWTNKSNRVGWSGYLGCDAGSDEVPVDAVPSRRENLSGLPPAWIGIGDIDLFYDESKAYTERLKGSGVDTVLDVVPGGFHGFEILAPKSEISKAFVQRHFDYVREALG